MAQQIEIVCDNLRKARVRLDYVSLLGAIHIGAHVVCTWRAGVRNQAQNGPSNDKTVPPNHTSSGPSYEMRKLVDSSPSRNLNIVYFLVERKNMEGFRRKFNTFTHSINELLANKHIDYIARAQPYNHTRTGTVEPSATERPSSIMLYRRTSFLVPIVL